MVGGENTSVENVCVSDTIEHVCDDTVILKAHGNRVRVLRLSTAFWVFNAAPALCAQAPAGLSLLSHGSCPLYCCLWIAFGVDVFHNNKQFLNCF